MDNRPYKIPWPKGYEEYIIRNFARSTYFIFKNDKATCTKCGKTHKLFYGKHNAEGYCPYCHEGGLYKEARYGRKTLAEYMRVMWFYKIKSVTFCQVDCVRIDFTEEKPFILLKPEYQYRFTKDKSKKYEKEYYGWIERKVITPPKIKTCWYGEARFSREYIFKPSLNKIGTDLKYANFDKTNYGYNIINYIVDFLKYPAIEVLEKSGFEKLTHEIAIRHIGKSKLNLRKKDLREILNLNGAEVKTARKEKWKMHEIYTYRNYKKHGVILDKKQINLMSTDPEANWLKRLPTCINKQKAVKYIEKNEIYIRDYRDYIKEIKYLGYDLKRKDVIFPKDFIKTHYESSQKYKVFADEIKQKEFQRSIRKMYPFREFIFKKFLIKPVQNIAELTKESEKLQHCVRTYADQIIKGESIILFIRKSKTPDIPFYTVELNEKMKLQQCRGYRNCSMTDEVKEFVEEYLKWLKKEIKKRKKAA